MLLWSVQSLGGNIESMISKFKIIYLTAWVQFMSIRFLISIDGRPSYFRRSRQKVHILLSFKERVCFSF